MQARYTRGPDELGFGHPDEIHFKRGEWRDVADEHRAQLLLPDRVAEFGFEVNDSAAPDTLPQGA